MEIFAKVGTMPKTLIRVGWKRNPLKIGDYIKFKRIPVQHGAEWETGIIDGIRDARYPLYLIERM